MAGNQNPGYPNVVAGRAADDNVPTDIFMDTASGAMYSGLWVWNATTLIWEKMTQPVNQYQDDEIVVPASITEDIFHYCVHEKIAFTMDVAADINGSEISIAFKTGSAAKYNHIMYQVDANAAANFTIYCGGTMSFAGGTDTIPINRNRIPSIPASTMEGYGTASWVANRVTLNSTITVGTAAILRHRHIGSGRKVGGSDDAAWEFVLPAATICALVIDDDAAGANVSNLVFSWFEVPPA